MHNTSAVLSLWLLPNGETAGGAGFTLQVNGANFMAKSVVLWNGAVRKTTYISSTELTAAISAADIAMEATDLVTIAQSRAESGNIRGAAVGGDERGAGGDDLRRFVRAQPEYRQNCYAGNGYGLCLEFDGGVGRTDEYGQRLESVGDFGVGRRGTEDVEGGEPGGQFGGV